MRSIYDLGSNERSLRGYLCLADWSYLPFHTARGGGRGQRESTGRREAA